MAQDLHKVGGGYSQNHKYEYDMKGRKGGRNDEDR